MRLENCALRGKNSELAAHPRISVHLLTRILHEGFGFYGQAGKAGGTIARGFIALAMDQGGSFKMRRQVVRKTK